MLPPLYTTQKLPQQPFLYERYVLSKSFSSSSPLIQGFATDTAYFSVQKSEEAIVQDKLTTYAQQLLKQAYLQPGKKLRIMADSSYLPLVRAMVEASYRDFHAGLVYWDLKEPQFEALKEKYNIRETFDYEKYWEKELKDQGVIQINLTPEQKHYQRAGLSSDQTRRLIEGMTIRMTPELQALMALDPVEIIEGCLSLQPGQPLVINGPREYLPQMLNLAEKAYQRGTRLIKIIIEEPKSWNLDIPFFKYAGEQALTEIPEYMQPMDEEYLKRNTAFLYLEGGDPTLYEEIDPKRIAKYKAAIGEKFEGLSRRFIDETPWTIYYAPTPASAKSAGYDNFETALVEARKITRTGHLKSHHEQLWQQTQKLNQLVTQGYRTLHFVSVNPQTGIPDGKTNLKVGLTPKSLFISVPDKTTHGQLFVANVPSEESFATPDWTKTEGVVAMTRPLSLNGTLVDGIRMVFKNGQIAKDEQGHYQVEATANKNTLLELLEKQKNADKLGEISLVANSPIFALNRIFNNTLIDENATCHLALGQSYAASVQGANDFQVPAEKDKYLSELNANQSTTHVDFMIGGPQVQVFLQKEGNSPEKPVIQNNQFVI